MVKDHRKYNRVLIILPVKEFETNFEDASSDKSDEKVVNITHIGYISAL